MLYEVITNNPKPVIMMSVLTQHGADATFKALDLGAFDFVPKPSTVLSMTVEDIGDLLRITSYNVCYTKLLRFRIREAWFLNAPIKYHYIILSAMPI